MNFPFTKEEEKEKESEVTEPESEWGVSFVDLEEPKEEENV